MGSLGEVGGDVLWLALGLLGTRVTARAAARCGSS